MASLQGIANANLPVICWDTCTILDIVRDPTRDSALAQNHLAAIAIIEAIERGEAFGLVAPQVTAELAENLTDVLAAARAAIAKYTAQHSRLASLVDVYGTMAQSDLTALSNHVQNAQLVMARLTLASIPAEAPDKVTELAFDRVGKAKAPASKGNQSMKDCVVIETYLHSVQLLRSYGHTAPIVFSSSNTRDYMDGSKLHPDLVSEFAAINLQYAAPMHYVKHLLTI